MALWSPLETGPGRPRKALTEQHGHDYGYGDDNTSNNDDDDDDDDYSGDREVVVLVVCTERGDRKLNGVAPAGGQLFVIAVFVRGGTPTGHDLHT